MARAANDTTRALTFVEYVTSRNETAWEANMMEADLREARGDKTGAIRALDRLNWIWPYDPLVHVRLATLSAAQGDRARAVLERRAIIAMGPTDLLDARYELARALRDAGDIAGARRELLQVLEEAPSFEKAQALLLELRRK
jgi:tetratricopeptide (TPR) repeat protein